MVQKRHKFSIFELRRTEKPVQSYLRRVFPNCTNLSTSSLLDCLLESDLHASLALASRFLPSTSHGIPFFLTLLLLTISLSSFLDLSLQHLSSMGNALRFLYRCCFKPDHDSNSLAPHGATHSTAGVSALAHDIFHYEITSQVPDGLSQYVVSSKKAQANWYNKLLQAWKEAKPPPRTTEEAARLVVQTLKRHKTQDVEGLLAFYGLPLPQAIVQPSGVPSSLPQGVQFELRTLPVDGKAVADGDTVTVYVETTDPRESSNVPIEIHQAAIERSKARAAKNYSQADAFHKVIIDAGYRVLKDGQNNEVLAKKYRIRLRGIDAPESSMPYGKEAKELLLNIVQGKCLQLFVYGEDRYNRCVADIYCDGLFVQELMLKKGCAWHYVAYDQRPELAAWEREARSSRVGLWAASNPEMPWEWRKDMRNRA